MPIPTCPAVPETALFPLRDIARHALLAAGLVAVMCNVAAAAQAALPDRPAVPPLTASPASPPESRQVDLLIDFAVILQIAGDVSVIVLGNSDIADASVVAAGTIALSGKAVGTTNVVVLGADGGVLAELRVEVAAHKPGSVTVRRALLPSSYACTASSCRRLDDGAASNAAP